jgi:type II secretory pathway component PulJ
MVSDAETKAKDPKAAYCDRIARMAVLERSIANLTKEDRRLADLTGRGDNPRSVRCLREGVKRRTEALQAELDALRGGG